MNFDDDLEIDYDDIRYDSWTMKLSYIAADRTESDYEDDLKLVGGPEISSYQFGDVYTYLFAEETDDLAKHYKYDYIIFMLSVGYLRSCLNSINLNPLEFNVTDPLLDGFGGSILAYQIAPPLYVYFTGDYFSNGEEYDGQDLGLPLVYVNSDGETYFG